jgi:hypothetical protein
VLIDSFLLPAVYLPAQAMSRPIASVDMKRVESVGPCLAPKATTLEIELCMKVNQVNPPLRMVCTTRQDRRDWLQALGALI